MSLTVVDHPLAQHLLTQLRDVSTPPPVFRTLAKRLTKKQEMEHVAAISTNNDPVIGKIMADAFEKVGKDGVITVE